MLLTRYAFLEDCTLGKLRFGGQQVFTIERPWRDNEAWVSCIPDGEYVMAPYSSAKYPDVWEVMNVPGRTHILIHAANFAHQLAGCIAPGLGRRIQVPSADEDANAVWTSRKACGRVFEFLAAQLTPTLTIRSAAATV